MNTREELKDAFRPVPAAKMDQGQSHKILRIQEAAMLLGEEILDKVPACADRTHALRILLDVKFWCVQAISHGGTTVKVPPKAPVTPQKEDKDEKTPPAPQTPAQ